MKKIIRLLAALVALVAVVLTIAMWRTRPEPPAADSESARRLAGGPYSVTSSDYTFVDSSRPTAANGDFPGAPERTLEATLWYPRGDDGPHPLVVYSHGFMSMRTGGRYIAEHLASHGYVVLSADFPLTNFFAPGGPNVDDAVNQPADVAFMIGEVLSWTSEQRPFAGSIDEQRIGVVGVSMGGLTSTLVAFHRRWRDPRVDAAISIAGPTVFFSKSFFSSADVPFLMIAATDDAMIDFDANAARVPEVVPDGRLVSIERGSHAGFAQPAAGLMRLLGNPDGIGCRALLPNLDIDPNASPVDFGDESDGIVTGPMQGPLPCANGIPDEALNPGRQHMITKLAVHAFFESRFAPDEAERLRNERYLSEVIATDFPEASFRSQAALGAVAPL
jgi:dienelactone hydrolase